MATTLASFNVITDATNRVCETRGIELGPVSHVRWMQGSQAFNLVCQGGKEYLIDDDTASIVAKFRAAGIVTHVLGDAVKDGAPMIVPAHQIVGKKWDGHFTTITVGIAPPRHLLVQKNPFNLDIEP